MPRACWILLWAAAVAAAGPPPLSVGGHELSAGGSPVGLFGVSLSSTHTFWARGQRLEQFETALDELPKHGFNAVRVPVNVAYLQPAPGIFPDHPRYLAELDARGLRVGYAACLDALLSAADRLGLYVLVELTELPCDPYRWFTGGDEDQRGGGDDGGGLAWMADVAALREHLPPLFGWLATRWRGRAVIAGFELPFTPVGGEPALSTEDWVDLAAACARAVELADPDRLTFFVPPGDGSGTAPGSVARPPDGVDGVAPRFWLGPNSPAARIDDAYSAVPAAWLSGYRGWRKPVLIGAYGPTPEHVAWPPAFDPGPEAARRLYDACLAAWRRQGAAGAFARGWDGGLADPLGEGRILGDAARVPVFAGAYRQGTSPPAEVALVTAPEQRGADGSRGGLVSLARLLVELGVAPFDSLLPPLDPARLAGYRVILAFTPGLDDASLAALRGAGARWREYESTVIDPDSVRDLLRAAGVACEPRVYPVWRIVDPGGVVLYNWTGAPASVGEPVREPDRLGVVETGEVLESAGGIARIFVPAWGSRQVRRLAPDESLPPPPEQPPRRPDHELPPLLKLYERGPVRGRWLEPWYGATARLRHAEDEREVIVVGTDGPEQWVGIRFDRGRPVGLASWFRQPEARLEVLLRLTDTPPSALEVRLEGPGEESHVAVSLAGTGEWQVVSLPLAKVRPAGRPSVLTGIALRLAPAGSAEIAAFWLSRPMMP